MDFIAILAVYVQIMSVSNKPIRSLNVKILIRHRIKIPSITGLEVKWWFTVERLMYIVVFGIIVILSHFVFQKCSASTWSLWIYILSQVTYHQLRCVMPVTKSAVLNPDFSIGGVAGAKDVRTRHANLPWVKYIHNDIFIIYFYAQYLVYKDGYFYILDMRLWCI